MDIQMSMVRSAPRSGADVGTRHAIIIAGTFALLCLWLHFGAWSITSWYDDDLIFARLAEARSATAPLNLLSLSLHDGGELYTPALTFFWPALWHLFGNESEAFKFVAATLILGDALLLYWILAQLLVAPAWRLAGCLLFLLSPAMVECYLWPIAMQHTLTVGCGLALTGCVMRANRGLAARDWMPVGLAILGADAAAIGGGYGREPIAVLAGGLLVLAPLYLSRWRHFLAASPALFVFPRQLYSLVWQKNGWQVMAIFAHAGIYGSPLEADLKILDPTHAEVYLTLFAAQVALLMLPVLWRSEVDTSRLPRTRRVAWLLSVLLALIAFAGFNRLGVAMLTALPGLDLVPRITTGGRWIEISAPTILAAIGTLSFGAIAVWRNRPILIAAATAAELAFALYLHNNAFPADTWHSGGASLFARYTVYLLPIVIVTLCIAADGLPRRAMTYALFGAAAIGAIELGVLSWQRGHVIEADYVPAKGSCLGLSPAELILNDNRLLATEHIAPLTAELVQNDGSFRPRASSLCSRAAAPPAGLDAHRD